MKYIMNAAKPYTKRNRKRKEQPTQQIAYKIQHNKMQSAISKLQLNQEFANAVELFDCLDIYLPNSGNQRETVIQKLLCYINYASFDSSQKIYITDIYETSIPWIDGRSQGNHRKKQIE